MAINSKESEFFMFDVTLLNEFVNIDNSIKNKK